MTVATTNSRDVYNGDGVTNIFSTSFAFISDSDLIVTLIEADGTQSVKVLNSDYTVSGGDGGTGSITTATFTASATEQIVIQREVPYTQGIDLVPNDPFPADTIERGLDRLTYQVQQVLDLQERSIRLDIDQDPTVVDPVLPDPNGDFFLKWNSAGTALENATAPEAPTTPFAATILDDTSAGDVLTTLGVTALAQTLLADATTGDMQTTLGITAFAQTILDDTNAAAVRTTIDAQEETAASLALSALTPSANKIPMFTGTGSATTIAARDEDDMASDDAAGVPSQQSVKAYVDNEIPAYVDPRTNHVTPEMFGAVGNGTTDDKAAIQQALDDGRPVFFDGSKTYALGSFDSVTLDDANSGGSVNRDVALDLNTGQVIYGNGATLLCDNASTDIMLAASGRTDQVKIYDLKIDCNNQAAIGIYANDWPSPSGIHSGIWSPYWHLADVLITNFSKAGMILSTFVSQFDRCEVSGNTSSGSDYGIVIAAPGWYAGGEANPDAAIAGTSLTFNSCWPHNVNGPGWYFHEVSNSALNGCAADACDVAYKMRRAKGIAMNGCGAEKCSQWIIVDPWADALTINAGFWLHAGCTASSVSVSWLPASAPAYWMTFTGNESGIVNISGFRIASKDNAPGTDHLRIDGTDMTVVSSQWRDAVSNNATDWPTAAVFSGNTGAKDTDLARALP
jgi:hypothetical protein